MKKKKAYGEEYAEWYWYLIFLLAIVVSFFEKEETDLGEEAKDIDTIDDEESMLFWSVIFIPVLVISFFRNLFEGLFILFTGGLQNNPNFRFKKDEARGSFSV